MLVVISAVHQLAFGCLKASVVSLENIRIAFGRSVNLDVLVPTRRRLRSGVTYCVDGALSFETSEVLLVIVVIVFTFTLTPV